MARSLRKGPYVDPSLQRKVDKLAAGGGKGVVKTWSRRSMITPDFVGLTFHVHNGKLFMPVFVTENMVCLLYTSPSPRDQRGSRMPSSA